MSERETCYTHDEYNFKKKGGKQTNNQPTNHAFHLFAELFFRRIEPIFMLAILGTASSALSIAFTLELVKMAGWIGDFEPPLAELLAFGGLISATDPVTTLAVFSSKKVDPHLFYLVFGESCLNDAVGLVLFHAFSQFVSPHNEVDEMFWAFVQFLLDFCIDFIGSLCLGFFSGAGAAVLLKQIDMRQTPLLELSLYILVMYVPFFLAEIMELSGIVTILFTGIAAKRYAVPNLSPNTDSDADVIFRLTSHLAETAIFLELGLSVFGMAGQGHFHWKFIIWSFVAVLVGRIFNVYPIVFFFNSTLKLPAEEFMEDTNPRTPRRKVTNVEMTEKLDVSSQKRYDEAVMAQYSSSEAPVAHSNIDLKIPLKTAHMMWFAGLRGAVAYACAKSFPDAFEHRTDFIVTTMCIVLGTVFLLGSTTGLVLKLLHIDMDVDEESYMAAHTERLKMGVVNRFENRFIFPHVIRGYATQQEEALQAEQAAASPPSFPRPPTERPSSLGHIEVTEEEHLDFVKRLAFRRKKSLYDYGASV